MFVRFVVGSDSENAFRLAGVFTVSWQIRQDGELFGREIIHLDEIYDWFNRHLPYPPFREKFRSGEWSSDAVCWFRDQAGEPIRRIWDVVALLREHGTSVRLVKTDKPGKIVYADRYQVVAETPYWV